MTSHRDVKGYNAGAMILHWAIAAAIAFQLVVGFAMTSLDVIPDGLRFAVFQWHKTIGLLVLTLTLARIAWRLFNPPPRHAPMPAIESAAASIVHTVFYGLMLLVPLAGWAVVSASPTAIPTLLMMSERLPWPNLPLPASWHGKAGEDVAETLHAWLAYSTAALLVLHVAGALKHSILDRVPSFSRMLPISGMQRQPTSLLAIPLAAGLAAVFLAGGVSIGRDGADGAPGPAELVGTAAPDEPSGWTIDKAASTIGYDVSFSGKTIEGTVEKWDTAVTFDPAALSSASALVTVDPSSITVGDPFVRSNVPGPDGFDVTAHPVVTVKLDRFEKSGEGFIGRGTLTIKNKTAPVEVPFSFTPSSDGGGAHIVGTAVLDRLTFDLGAQNDATGQWLGKEVKVHIDLSATPSSGSPKPSPAS